MLSGSIEIIPISVRIEPGQTVGEDGETPSPMVVQTLEAQNGNIRAAFPLDSVDSIIDGLQKAKELAQQNTSHPDIYIPSSSAEVEQIASAAEEVQKLKDPQSK
jgi:hypothetical protein